MRGTKRGRRRRRGRNNKKKKEEELENEGEEKEEPCQPRLLSRKVTEICKRIIWRGTKYDDRPREEKYTSLQKGRGPVNVIVTHSMSDVPVQESRGP